METYGFKEGTPIGDGEAYLCYVLVGRHSSEGWGAPSYPSKIARGFWMTGGKCYSYFMDDMGWIGWKDAICLLYHPIPVEETRDKNSKCLPHVWEQEFAWILHKTK